MLLRYIFSFVLGILSILSTFSEVDTSLVDSLGKAVVKIESTILLTSGRAVATRVSPNTRYVGTGNLIDKQDGIILTNSHIALSASICNYIIKFQDGTSLTARYLYSDPRVDMGLLKIDENELEKIPEEVQAVRLSPFSISKNQKLFTIGNSAGLENFVSELTVSKRYFCGKSSIFPYEVALLTGVMEGGTSGSCVFNIDGEAVGLLYGGNTASRAFIIPIEYAVDMYEKLKRSSYLSDPVRKTVDARLELLNINDIERYIDSTNNLVDKYLINDPEAEQSVIFVTAFFPGGEGRGLNRNDIILEINGKPVGASVYKLQKYINETKVDAAKFLVLRYKDDRYSLEEVEVFLRKSVGKASRMISYGGVVFVEEMYDYFALKYGSREDGVYTYSAEGEGCFSGVLRSNFPVKLSSLGGENITSLDDLINCGYKLKDKKFSYLTKRNVFYLLSLNSNIQTESSEYVSFVDLWNHERLKIYTWNQETLSWDIEVKEFGD